jgi:nitrite reductase/ring-hydroxylating ferredoxin subunit
MTDIHDKRADDGAECGGCSLHDALNAPAAIERREFLRAGALALTSLGLLGLGARTADAMPVVREITALAPRGGDRHSEKRYPIPAADGVSIDKDNNAIIARAAGKVYAFSLGCPHQNTSLRWNADDKQFMCPKHKSHYRPDGTFIDGRATRDMDRLAVRRDGQVLVVDVDMLYQQDLNTAQWTAAFIPG